MEGRERRSGGFGIAVALHVHPLTFLPPPSLPLPQPIREPAAKYDTFGIFLVEQDVSGLLSTSSYFYARNYNPVVKVRRYFFLPPSLSSLPPSLALFVLFHRFFYSTPRIGANKKPDTQTTPFPLPPSLRPSSRTRPSKTATWPEATPTPPASAPGPPPSSCSSSSAGPMHE